MSVRVPDGKLITLRGWPQGINNLSAETELDLGKAGPGGKVTGELRVAENLDLDERGKISQRAGYSQVETLAGLHSLYAHKRFSLMLAVYNGQLVSFDRNLVRASRLTLISRTSRMSYDYDAGWVYFTNGFDSGRINESGQVEPWGLKAPIGQPTLTAAAAGGLAAGTYQVAITYLDGNGRESGATLAAEIELESGQGLALSSIPQPTEVSATTVRVYATSANGSQLRYVRDLAVGMTTASVGVHTPGKPLATQFCEPLPAGQIVRIYRGRMYVIRNRVLYWSEAMNYGQGVLAANYLSFNENGTLLEGVHSDTAAGMFAAFGKRTYFFTGSEPKQWQKAIAHPHGAVLGSSTLADGQALEQESSGDIPYWLDDSGQFVIGTPDGRVRPLHAERFVGPVNVESAASVFREAGGLRHFLTTTTGGGVSPLAVGDRVEAEVWKNGVRIS
jgi:hypothetical protein